MVKRNENAQGINGYTQVQISFYEKVFKDRVYTNALTIY